MAENNLYSHLLDNEKLLARVSDLEKQIEEIKSLQASCVSRYWVQGPDSNVWNHLQPEEQLKLFSANLASSFSEIIPSTGSFQLWEFLFQLLAELQLRNEEEGQDLSSNPKSKMTYGIQYLYLLARFVESEQHFPYANQIHLVLNGEWDTESWSRRIAKSILLDPKMHGDVNKSLRSRLSKAVGVDDNYFQEQWKQIYKDLPKDLLKFHADKTLIHRRNNK